jgi:hypothetical protein
MGWQFRKSLNFGPLRVNLGKRGVGYSFGTKGFRTGVRSNGRRYSSFSIPGTGLRYEQLHQPGGRGCSIVLLVIAVASGGVAVGAALWGRIV